MSNIKKIVLTGGPSGGKTEAFKRVKSELSALGVTAYTLGESASEIIKSGADRLSAYDFQKAIALNQIRMERELESLEPDDNAVIICDRGLMDCTVYLDEDEFTRLKKELNLSDTELRDRYDAAFHFDSTASDEDIDYITDSIRTENRSEAARINERSLRAWCGNPHYRFIPVMDTYEEKFAFFMRELKAFLGIPKPLEIERKFLIKYPDTDFLLTLPCRKIEISQTYMLGAQGKFRLRKRGENGGFIFIKTVKEHISDTIREEREDRLSEEEYNLALSSGIQLGTITKDRYCLMYNGTYFEIDIFPFWKNQAYIEVELMDENDEIKLPPFIEVIREVTHDARYKNSSLIKEIPEEDKFS